MTNHRNDTHGWNLDEIYPTEESWDDAVAQITNRISAIEKTNHRVSSANDLATLLDDISILRGQAGKLAKVGLLQHFTDTKNEIFLRKMEQSEFLETQVESAVGFINDVINQIPPDVLSRWLHESPPLRKHQRRINRILRAAPYKLLPESESVIADLARLPRTANDFYRQLLDSDLDWPSFNGQELTPSTFSKIRSTGSLKERETASKLYFEHLGKYEDLFALALTRRIEGDALIAKHRGLNSSVDTLLVLQDGFESDGHKQIFEAIAQSKHKIKFIVSALTKYKMQPYLVPSDFRALSKDNNRIYDQSYAKKMTLKAAELVSAEYRDIMAVRLEMPWMHLLDSENKSNTVGVFWQVGGGNPHTIFKYRNDYISFRLYSSAAFLMMGLAEIKDDNAPDRREEDLPVYSNTLWYLGHFLQTNVMLNSNNPPELKRQVLANLITRTLNTLINYAAMVQLEDHISQKIMEGSSVLPNDINDFYLSALRSYFTHSNMKIDEHWRYGWISESFAFYGPHYASFYQAISSALAMKKRLEQKDPKVIDAIQYGIANSDTHYSSDVLLSADIDMNNVDTYLDAIDALHKMAQSLEEI